MELGLRGRALDPNPTLLGDTKGPFRLAHIFYTPVLLVIRYMEIQ